MRTKYIAGLYRLYRADGSVCSVQLTAAEAKLMFKLYKEINFIEIQLVEN